MQLILAIVWFLAGVGILAYETFGDNTLHFPRLGNISSAWLAFLLCGYNLLRWQGRQAARRERQAMELWQARRDRETHREREPGRDIDPNFDFTSDPPPPRRPNITDQPPSRN
jgi:hypothetical protein